jgi:voltage-gated potassium channel
VDRLLQRKYLALLVALLFLLVVYPLLRGILAERLTYDALMATVFLVALVTVFTSRHRLLALLLGLPTIVGMWTGYVLPGLARVPLVLAFHAAAALFLAFAITVILADVHRQDQIGPDTVYGSLCGYLMVGLWFAHLYCILETTLPGSFRASEEILAQLRNEGQIHYQLTYFSFSTLTTVGYGDISPARGGARGLAVVEAMTGQFYVAVLLGELIGKRVSQAITERAEASNP